MFSKVCSLKWSGDHRYLASGGNDNLVHVWEGTTGQVTRSTPIHVFKYVLVIHIVIPILIYIFSSPVNTKQQLKEWHGVLGRADC